MVSIICAVFVGLAFVGGIGTMLPIMRVLIAGENVETWINRQIVEKRMGVSLSDNPQRIQIVSIRESEPAAQAGLGIGNVIAEGSKAPVALRALALGPEDVELPGVKQRLALKPLPIYLKWAQSIAARFPSNPVGSIAAVLVFILAISTIGNIARYFQEHYSDRACILAINDIRRQLYDHVLHTPLAYFGTEGTSDVTSRLVGDCNGLQDGFKTVLGQSIQEPIKVVLAFALALLVSWKLTLFIVLFGPIMFVIIKKFGKKMRRAARVALQKSASMLGQIQASLMGIRVVKAANAERFERRRYTRIMDKLVEEQLRMSRIDALSSPVMETLNLIVICVVVLFAAYLVLISKTLESTSFFLVMVSLAAIGESLRRIGKVNNALQRSNSAAQRIFDLLDLPVERPRRLSSSQGEVAGTSPAPRPRTKLHGVAREVKFENVTFGYANTTQVALDDISLTVEKGRSIAIVGRNGSGKTTLLAMLPRFYDPSAGRILIDGVDVRDVTLKSLRDQIGIVTQDTVIFPGTIAENIAYGMPLTTHAAIEEAAKRAFAHDFILEKPLGYDTPLDGLGAQLSGGQKQRLNIARAILNPAPILILDEATSQVDAESEHLIQQAIESLMKERTTFVIAHRFSTIKSADLIVVIDRGRIVGQGQHEELMTTCQTYQNLYERQVVT